MLALHRVNYLTYVLDEVSRKACRVFLATTNPPILFLLRIFCIHFICVYVSASVHIFLLNHANKQTNTQTTYDDCTILYYSSWEKKTLKSYEQEVDLGVKQSTNVGHKRSESVRHSIALMNRLWEEKRKFGNFSTSVSTSTSMSTGEGKGEANRSNRNRVSIDRRESVETLRTSQISLAQAVRGAGGSVNMSVDFLGPRGSMDGRTSGGGAVAGGVGIELST